MKDYNILYTDDDKDDQDIFKDAASEISTSLRILTLSDGDELIDFLKTSSPSKRIIFLDLNMPLKNGYEVLKEIKGLDRLKDLPVIIFSTSDDAAAISATRELGASLYIPKPSSFTSLKNIIAYSLSIDWETFSPSDEDFVYRGNLSIQM